VELLAIGNTTADEAKAVAKQVNSGLIVLISVNQLNPVIHACLFIGYITVLIPFVCCGHLRI